MTLNYYKVRQGDELFRIMRDHYGDAGFLKDKQALVAALRANNPHIPDIDRIYPGQVIMFPDTPRAAEGLVCLAPPDALASGHLAREMATLDAPLFDSLVAIGDSTVTRTLTGGVMSHLDIAAGKAIKSAQDIAPAYWDMRARKITRGQYDYARRIAVKEVDGHLGLYRKVITPGKTAAKVLRIDRTSELRTNKIASEIADLKRIGKTARQGATILKYAEIPITAAKVHMASSNKERSVIVIRDGSSIAMGLGAGALAVVIFGTPAGWVGIAAVAVVGIVGSEVGERVGEAVAKETLFDASGNRINTKMDRMWQPFYGPQ